MNLSEGVAYLNARLRARKSRLLGATRLREAAALESVDVVVARLADTPYAPDLLRASAAEPDPARAADAAFGRNLAEDLARIRSFAPGLTTSPARYLFEAWDLANLKAALRGVRAGATPEAIAAACSPAGFVPAAVWEELARSDGLQEAVAKAGSMDLGFRRGLREGWEAFARSGRPGDLEGCLDRHFFRRAAEALGDARGAFWDPLRTLVAFDVDVRNLLAALEWVGRLEPPAGEPIPGGARTGEAFSRRLASSEDPTGDLAEASHQVLGPAGEEAARLLDAGRAEAAAEALEVAAWRERARRLHGPPLSLALLIGYLWAKAAEVADLRRIVWGLDLGQPAAWIDGGLLAT